MHTKTMLGILTERARMSAALADARAAAGIDDNYQAAEVAGADAADVAKALAVFAEADIDENRQAAEVAGVDAADIVEFIALFAEAEIIADSTITDTALADPDLDFGPTN
jgi:hypothetical protein